MARINIDFDKLRALPLRLKVVAGVIVVDAVFLLAGYLALDSFMAERVAKVDALKSTLSQLKKQDADLRHQADEYPGLRQRYEAAIASGIATPLDRLKFVQSAQDWSSHHHVTDLHYRVGADTVPVQSSPNFHTEIDRIVFENTALLDLDVLAFWNEIYAKVDGHYRVAELVLERVREVDPTLLTAVRRGNPSSTIKAKLDLQWTGLARTVKEAQQ